MSRSERPKVGSSFKKFLCMYTCFLIFNQIHIIFLNTFILRALSDNGPVMIYNITLAVTQPVAMVAAVFICRRISLKGAELIGFGLYITAYALLAILGERAASLYVLIGVLISTAAGLYYTPHSLQLLSTTNDENRDRAMGIVGISTGIAALLTPILSSELIKALGGFAGYQALFGVAFVLVVLAAIFCLRIPKMQDYDENDRHTHLMHVARAMLHSRPHRDVAWAAVVTGFRSGTMAFYVNLLIYSIIQDETLVGLNSTLGGLAAILCSFLYTAFVRHERRSQTIFLGVTVLSVATLALFFRLDPVTLIIYNVIANLATYAVITPPESAYMNVIQNHHETKGMMVEVHTVKEFYLSAGRVLGLGLTMLLPATNTGSVIVMLALNLTQYLLIWFVADSEKYMERYIAEKEETEALKTR